MFSGYKAMLSIMQQAHAQKLTSVSLLEQKVAQQVEEGFLHYTVYYVRHTKLVNLKYNDDADSGHGNGANCEAASCTPQRSESGIEPRALNDDKNTQTIEHETTLVSTYVTKDIDTEAQAVTQQIGALEMTASTQEGGRTLVMPKLLLTTKREDEQRKPRVTTCALLEECVDLYTPGPSAPKSEIILQLKIENITRFYTQDSEFEQDALCAIQEFAQQGQKDLINKNTVSVIEDIAPHILAQQYLHIREKLSGIFVLAQPITQLKITIQRNGELRYNSAYIDYAETQESSIALYKDNYLLDTWFGRIQQINYQCLYDSIGTIFATIYAQTDIQFAMLSEEIAEQMLYTMFNNMHFPKKIHNTTQHHSKDTEKQDIPRMATASVICSIKDEIAITELANMSVLLNIHKYLLDAEDTFAYELATALISDLKDLWELREDIMPRTQEYDVIQYGIVPELHDLLPEDYTRYPSAIIVPERMKSQKRLGQISYDYIDGVLSQGTYEMCAWGYALACLNGAIQISLVDPYRQQMLEQTLSILRKQIRTRFQHFSGTMSIQSWDVLRKPNMPALAGGAMPLFCMTICNVLSISQSLNDITMQQNNNTVLNIAELIRLDPEKCAKP